MPKSQKTHVKCAHASLPADQHIAAEYLCICEADGVRREKEHRMWKCVIHMWTLWFMWLKRCSLVYNFKFTCDVFFFLHFQIQSSHLRKYISVKMLDSHDWPKFPVCFSHVIIKNSSHWKIFNSHLKMWKFHMILCAMCCVHMWKSSHPVHMWKYFVYVVF